MEENEYQKMYELEEKYWWHVGRQDIIFSQIEKLLDSKNKSVDILDVGCGTGINFKILNRFGKVTGIDNSQLAINFCQKRGIKDVLKGEAEKLPLTDNSYDLVCAFDLIEHMDDDKKALREFYRVCKPSGYVFILAPAYQFLWSEHDEALHHKRRYTLSDLHRKLSLAGFILHKRSYLITFLFLPILIFRFSKSLTNNKKGSKTSYFLLPPPVNAFFIWLLKVESLLLRKINFPFGASVLTIGQKRVGHFANPDRDE